MSNKILKDIYKIDTSSEITNIPLTGLTKSQFFYINFKNNKKINLNESNTIIWDFGDGSEYVSNDIFEIVPHEFNYEGIYNINALIFLNNNTIHLNIIFEITNNSEYIRSFNTAILFEEGWISLSEYFLQYREEKLEKEIAPDEIKIFDLFEEDLKNLFPDNFIISEIKVIFENKNQTSNEKTLQLQLLDWYDDIIGDVDLEIESNSPVSAKNISNEDMNLFKEEFGLDLALINNSSSTFLIKDILLKRKINQNLAYWISSYNYELSILGPEGSTFFGGNFEYLYGDIEFSIDMLQKNIFDGYLPTKLKLDYSTLDESFVDIIIKNYPFELKFNQILPDEIIDLSPYQEILKEIFYNNINNYIGIEFLFNDSVIMNDLKFFVDVSNGKINERWNKINIAEPILLPWNPSVTNATNFYSLTLNSQDLNYLIENEYPLRLSVSCSNNEKAYLMIRDSNGQNVCALKLNGRYNSIDLYPYFDFILNNFSSTQNRSITLDFFSTSINNYLDEVYLFSGPLTQEHISTKSFNSFYYNKGYGIYYKNGLVNNSYIFDLNEMNLFSPDLLQNKIPKAMRVIFAPNNFIQDYVIKIRLDSYYYNNNTNSFEMLQFDSDFSFPETQINLSTLTNFFNAIINGFDASAYQFGILQMYRIDHSSGQIIDYSNQQVEVLDIYYIF